MLLTQKSLRDRQFALIEHYLERLADICRMYLQGRDHAHEALRTLDQDWQQLQAQQQWAADMALKDHRAAHLVTQFAVTARDLLMQVDIHEAQKWVDDALMWVDLQDIRIRYRLLAYSYDLRKSRRDFVSSRQILDEMQVLADKLGDNGLRSDVIRLNAGYYEEQGDYHAQLAWAERALELAQQMEDTEQVARSLHKIGFACFRLDQYSRADEYFFEALKLFKELGLREREAAVYNGLASSAYYSGSFDKVMVYGEEALAIAREFGRRETEIVIFTNLCVFMSGMGNLEKALHYGQQALTTSIEIGTRQSEDTALAGLLLTTARLGLADDVRAYAARLRNNMAEIPNPDVMWTVEWTLWYAAHERGEWETARSFAEPMMLESRRLEIEQSEHSAAGSLGDTLSEMGRFAEACEVYQRAIDLRADHENPLYIVHELTGLSYARTQLGQPEEAQRLLDDFFARVEAVPVGKIEESFTTLWNGIRAARALQDPRVQRLIDEFDAVLEMYLGYIHDERLRAAFLSQYTLRSLMALRSND